MNQQLLIGWCICLMLYFSCQKNDESVIAVPETVPFQRSSLHISEEAYYDKVLGALVGSAIGDALGAGTEMWHRSDIQRRYGYIQSLTPVTRPKSPEGIWVHNMVPGSTTDDTRWKYLMTKYLLANKEELSVGQFTEFMISFYHDLLERINGPATKSSIDLLDEELSKIDWIKEWARVALAREKGGIDYEQALHRFYGGEMSCAGLLYAPMFGLIHPQPYQAYLSAYEHAIFDIGYAKDITALSAALTSMALHTSDMDSMLSIINLIDPYLYKDSRLIGRLAEIMANESISFVENKSSIKTKDTIIVNKPAGYPGSNDEWIHQENIYKNLESRKKAIAFHSGEIFQILITGLAFGKGDFEKTLLFIVNYGRDNDTVASIAGFILGAKEGYSNLPEEMKIKSLAVTNDVVGIDLELLAQQLTDSYFNNFNKL